MAVNGDLAIDGTLIRKGARIETGASSGARIEFRSGGYVQLAENTSLDFSFLGDWVQSGRCIYEYIVNFGNVGAITGECAHNANDPSGSGSIIASQYIMTVTRNATVLTVLEGRVTTRGARSINVPPGYQVVMTRDFISEPHRLRVQDLQQLRNWLRGFDVPGGRPRIRLTRVPNLVESGLAEAERRLAAAGLTTGEIRETATNAVPPGTIRRQLPSAGSAVPPGTAAYLELAVPGVKRIRMPDLRNLDLESAEQALIARGLHLGGVYEELYAASRDGIVIEQSHPPDQEVDPGTVVNVVVTIAGGYVPGVIGYTLAEAQNRLSKAGFEARVISAEPDANLTPGTIKSQNPPGETLVKLGTSVDLVIARTPVQTPKIQPPVQTPKIQPPVQTPKLQTPVQPTPTPKSVCTVPDIIKHTAFEAQQILAKYGLKGQVRNLLGNTKYVSWQEYEAGTKLKCNSVVRYDVGQLQ